MEHKIKASLKLKRQQLMSKVKTITVNNLKAISSLTADFKGCTAIVTGANNKGKSTFLRGIIDRIRGIKPDRILRDEQSNGSAEIELTSGEKFVWSFKLNSKGDTTEKLQFITEKGIPTPATKDICRAYFPPVFDVDSFLNSTPKEQSKVLQKITGIEFTEIDKLYKDAFDARTYRNKRRDELAAKLEPINNSLPSEPVDVSSLYKILSEVNQHNLVITHKEQEKTSLQSGIDSNTKKIEELRKQISDLQQDTIDREMKIDDINEWLVANPKKDEDYVNDIQSQISSANEKNKEIEENLKAIQIQKDYDQAVQQAKEADNEVKRIEKEKQDVIKNAQMPDGFSFDDEGILYEGIPFNRESLSSSRIYIGALKLAAATIGEVRTLHFDASFLDKNSLAEIEEWANQNDMQLLIERPDFDAGEIRYEIIHETKSE